MKAGVADPFEATAVGGGAELARAATVGAGPEPARTLQQRQQPQANTRRLKVLNEALDNPRESLTRAGTILGTPIYMAPEVWEGRPATPASDIYSLGALLYQLAAGKPPLDGDTLEDLGRQVARDGEVEPLTSLAPGIAPGLAAVIHQCLQRDPSLRPATGNDLRAALVQLTPAGRGG